MLLTEFRSVVARRADALAVVVPDGERVTYGELSLRVDRALGWLRARGIGEGQVVATWLDNGIDYVALVFALAGSGAIHVPISRSATPEHIAWLVERTKPALVVSAEPLPDVVVEQVTTAELATGSELIGARQFGAHEGAFRLLETSGSTGKPRLVTWRQDDLLHDRRQWIAYTATTAADVLFNRHTLDVAHGCDVHLFPALLSGALLVLADPSASPDQLLLWLQETGATVSSALPRHYELLTQAAHGRSVDLSAMRMPLCGGAYLSGQAVADAAEVLGIHIRRIYGSTEFGIVLGNMDDAVQTTRGMTPVTGVEIRLAPLDAAWPSIGEVLARSTHTSVGYFDDAAATSATFRDGWYHTGDVAEFDGEYRILGRVADLLGGSAGPVFCPGVEAALTAACPITEAAVLAPLPGETEGGALVVATPAAGAEDERVRAAIRAVLEDLGVRAEIVLAATIPHTAVGKVDKPALRKGRTSNVRQR
ncbi:Linear gramicidin synthase subunit B [Micromonospora noduli]|uniref:Linear gramicidin synthase subunit B n=1 Tax=Micromonospora noduli TaxID=709876 RepID=A0ABX9D9M5_9ACTN|nr:class I adenylate-forming enzyme family protein [Micromonospora noduli]RAO25272.1 Linear gramicidin synthase subunit B [Micromonospora noduli]